MKNFRKISPEEIGKTPFEWIGEDWMLVCAQKPDGSVNAMTASWGGMGVMWGKNVAFVVIRPQRYTKEFIDSAQTFSLTFFAPQYKQELGYLGKVSGRDEDKIAKSGLRVAHSGETPYFEEGKMVMLCKKLYAQPMEKDCFLSADIPEKWYAAGDYHTLYVAEITSVLAE